jgi:hypothetical protein
MCSIGLVLRIPRDSALCLAHVSLHSFVVGTANGALIRFTDARDSPYRSGASPLCGGACALSLIAHPKGVVALVAWPEMGVLFSAGSDRRLCAWDAQDLFRKRAVGDSDPEPIWEWRGPSSFDRLELVPITGSVQERSEGNESWIEDTRSMWLVAASADGRCLHIIELADGEDASTWRHLSSMPLSRSTSVLHLHPPRTILYPQG